MAGMTGVFDRVGYVVSQGNHERDFPGSGSIDSFDSGGECGVPTQTRFPAPTQDPHFQDQGWFAFTHGPVTIVTLNSEFAVAPGSDQYAFLEASLKAVNRSVTPWVIATMHRPMYYVDDSSAGGVIDPAFQVFESLLYQYKVDVMLVGHVHNAYASCPVYNGSCVTAPAPGEYDAPVHISIGNAGQGISPINPDKAPGWVLYRAAEWGYSTLHFWNETDMSVNLYGDDDDGLRWTTSVHRNWPRGY
jgi:hypothetical protein